MQQSITQYFKANQTTLHHLHTDFTWRMIQPPPPGAASYLQLSECGKETKGTPPCRPFQGGKTVPEAGEAAPGGE